MSVANTPDRHKVLPSTEENQHYVTLTTLKQYNWTLKQLPNGLAISPACYELVLKNLHRDIVTSSSKIIPEANRCSGNKAKTIRNNENNESNLVSEEYKKKKIGDPLKSKSLLPRDREWNMHKLTTNTHNNSHPRANVWVQTQDQHEIVADRNSCLKPSPQKG